MIVKNLSKFYIFGFKFIKTKNMYKNLGLNTRVIPKFLNAIHLKNFFKISNDKNSLFIVDKKLRSKLKNSRNFLNLINSRRALRYRKKLPSNGQRTRSNSKTLKRYLKRKAVKIKKLQKKLKK